MDFNMANYCKLYLSNISKDVEEEEFKNYLTEFGEIIKFDLRNGKKPPFLKFCFITYAGEASETLLFNCLKTSNPYNIFVGKARPSKEPPGAPFEEENFAPFQGKQNNLSFKKDMAPSKVNLPLEEYSGSCLLCSKRAVYLCNCYVWYCSKTCQSSHWNIHYMDCQPTLTLATVNSLPAAKLREKSTIKPTGASNTTGTQKENYFKKKGRPEQSNHYENPSRAPSVNSNRSNKPFKTLQTFEKKQNRKEHFNTKSPKYPNINGESSHHHQAENNPQETLRQSPGRNVRRPSESDSNNFDKELKLVNKKQSKEKIVPKTAAKKELSTCSHVAVVHCLSPNSFFVQSVDNIETINSISNILAEKCSQVDDYIPVKGAMCASLFQGVWYRGLVRNVKKDSCDVFYLDFGNNEEVKFNSMCQLPPELENIPKMADRCVLDGVFSIDKTWSEADKDFFQKVTEDKTFTIPSIHKKLDYYVVRLQEMGHTSDLSQSLIGIDYGEPKKHDHSKVRVQYQIPALTAQTKVELLTIFQGVEFFYSHIKTVDEGPHKYLKIEEEINKSKLIVIKGVQPGDFVVAYSSLHQRWYRSLVLRVLQQKIQVFFIDYGNEEDVEEVAPLKSEWAMPANLFKFTSTKNMDDFLIETMRGDLIKVGELGVLIQLTEDNVIEGQLLTFPFTRPAT